MAMLDFRQRCPQCEQVASMFGVINADNPAELDAFEFAITGQSFSAHCPTCDVVCDVALFADGRQTEPWTSADDYERDNGPSAGPLPPRPWPSAN